MGKAEAIKRIREWNLNSEQLNTLAELIPELKEHKDEEIRQMIERTLRDAVLSERISETSYREMWAYLEKQKKQKTAEWSEEDEIHLKNAILAAENEWGVDSCTATWLKSLRPHWKPSEEQMKSLEWWCDATKETPGGNKLLVALYNDLKKLL